MHPLAELHELREGLRSGAFSSVELTHYYLRRIAEVNDKLNAFIHVDAEGALSQAAAADADRNTESGPLHGIPIAHKDIFCTAGLPTTCASRMLENFIAPYDATVVTHLKHSRVVLLGKTNMDEFAMGSSNENSHFGPVANPWDHSRVPGGSSGGSAAAVAAALTPAATGTDTGGSVRQPAAFCGITGFKPTYGRVSRYGMIAFASSLDQAGTLTRSVADAALLFAHMAGFDPRDSTSASQAEPWLDALRSAPPGACPKLRIGLPREYFAQLEDHTRIDALSAGLRAAGHELREVSLPHTDAAVAAYYVIAGAEASTNLSRYDGVRYGHRCDDPVDLEDLFRRSRSEGFGAEVKRRILTGTYALSVGYYDAYYLKAQKIRRLISADFSAAFEGVDVLLTPTAPGVAFAQNTLADPVAMYNQDIFTVPTSLAGLPALSVPIGLQDGLPVGAQLIAPAFAEDRLLALGLQLQQQTDWHQQIAEDVA
ncbi:MAG: Asp-tRNA(Asn)/Glu-tRNA(Gln) amidotransferase subunit GatA [Pseudomonadota bacterium]